MDAAKNGGDSTTLLLEYEKVALDSGRLSILIESDAADPLVAIGINLAHTVLANKLAKSLARRFLKAAGVFTQRDEEAGVGL